MSFLQPPLLGIVLIYWIRGTFTILTTTPVKVNSYLNASYLREERQNDNNSTMGSYLTFNGSLGKHFPHHEGNIRNRNVDLMGGPLALSLNLSKDEQKTRTMRKNTDCHLVYSFDASSHLQQKDGEEEAKVYHYQSTSPTLTIPSSPKGDVDGLFCFSKIMKCISIASSKKIINCVYFSREFCTRFHKTQMRLEGKICAPLEHELPSFREVECNEGGRKCRHEKSLCFFPLTKPRYSSSSSSSQLLIPKKDEHPVCLCPAGFTGAACAQIDLNVFQIDQLHTIDLRNILLKYQQKDRYFIGVTLLLLLVFTFCSILLIVACCTFLFVWLSKIISNYQENKFKKNSRKVAEIQSRRRQIENNHWRHWDVIHDYHDHQEDQNLGNWVRRHLNVNWRRSRGFIGVHVHNNTVSV